MDAIALTCRHCGTENFVAECPNDGRSFVLTTAHLEGRLREFEDRPVEEFPPGAETPLCDFCAGKAAGLGLAELVNAGLRQKTCPACHTEFISDG